MIKFQFRNDRRYIIIFIDTLGMQARHRQSEASQNNYL